MISDHSIVKMSKLISTIKTTKIMVGKGKLDYKEVRNRWNDVTWNVLYLGNNLNKKYNLYYYFVMEEVALPGKVVTKDNTSTGIKSIINI